MMRRFSAPPLVALVVLAAGLAAAVYVLLTHSPVPAAIAAKLAGKTANTVQGRTFDKNFGSLGALVPQTGVTVAPSADDDDDDDAPDTAEATPASHGGQYRDLGWLKAQNPQAVTLQVLGARSEESVKQFIAGQKDSSSYSYFQVQQGGQPWYVVVYGSYATREEALGAADDIDLGLGTRPFPKRFGAYVSDATVPTPQPAPPAASGISPTPAPADAPLPPPPPGIPAPPAAPPPDTVPAPDRAP